MGPLRHGDAEAELAARQGTNKGPDYEQGHLLRAKCVHMGCVQHVYSIDDPFVDPSVHVRMGAHLNGEEALNDAKEIIIKFHKYYDSEGNLLPWVVETLFKEVEALVNTKLGVPLIFLYLK